MGTLRETFGLSDRRRARDMAQDALLRGFSFTGPGGVSASFDPSTGRITTGLGDLAGLRSQLLDFAGGNLTGTTDLPPWLTGAAMGAVGDMGAVDFSGLTAPSPLQLGTFSPVAFGAAPQLTGMTFGGFTAPTFTAPAAQQFDRGLEEALRTGALGQLGIATADPFALGADRLRVLREQAAPHEERALSSLQDTLFSQGRLGSTGGAMQMEAFARGLAQADLDRQLAAADFGRALQADATGRVDTLLGQRSATRQLEELLNQGVFGRELAGFGANLEAALGGFGANLDAGRLNLESLFGTFDRNLGAQFGAFDRNLAAGESAFDRNLAARAAEFDSALRSGAFGLDVARTAADTNLQRALSRFGVAQELFGTGMNAQQQRFTQALAALGAGAGLDASAMQAFQAALNTAIARSNAAHGSAGVLANIGTNPVSDSIGSFLSDVSQFFSPIRLFGGPPAPTTP